MATLSTIFFPMVIRGPREGFKLCWFGLLGFNAYLIFNIGVVTVGDSVVTG